MLTTGHTRQEAMEVIRLEELVPEDHLLRIDRYIDFSFIHDLCAPYYSKDNGRPAIEPEILFKMLFLGYLYGIRSERRLLEEIRFNVVYRWFLGYGLKDPLPDVSVIWQNRKRRFRGTDVPQQIFDEILQQCMDAGLVRGVTLYTDSTHLKANANKNKFVRKEVELTPKAYLKELGQSGGKRPGCAWKTGPETTGRNTDGNQRNEMQHDGPGQRIHASGWETKRVFLFGSPHGRRKGEHHNGCVRDGRQCK